MKKIVFITLSLLLAVSFWNCEKDDICAEGTPTTPRLIIEFYNAATPTAVKNVSNLKVIAPNRTDDGFIFNEVSKIEIPLKTSADITTLNFIQNGNTTNTADDNVDVVTFNYGRADEYISRACGFKTLFYLNTTNPVEVTNDGSNWIQNIIVTQPYIETENEVHVKIYF
ncbi:DUF6452 family protein [Flavobacterium sp. HXWNR69]|uniref:DUF6452 family protein n=1 Tax=Flavobacterium fragile TaxID=2949085 RepID=A0ABT0TJU5_9FLAO|nr:DUF6452 family protein [Flavobacterium sp. HXWNR69]MCL9771162.1 DUF6452 family protein [Flavobacterium sp. HXWNR69]